jgi:Ni2+-binding GTPase involved in maturation of urease and hydrogenase
MTSPVLFACVGGFLGAGKTSAIVAAARTLKARGLRVGVVANDQGSDLVDTAVFRGAGLPASEIAGGCFCCRFDELVAASDRLLRDSPVDVLLAEAVGSCTDLVATVYRPLRRFHPDRFRLAPFSVLVEPDRLREMGADSAALDPDVVYLFGRQIAEAELLVLTKTDVIRADVRDATRRTLQGVAPGVPVLEMSSVRGDGVVEWVDRLLGDVAPVVGTLEVDYEAYGRGEAALGWLNAALELRRPGGLAPRACGEAIVVEIREGMRAARAFLPHAKVLVASSLGSARIALARTGDEPVWTGDPDLPPEPALSVIVNVRAAMPPARLELLIAEALRAVADRLDARLEVGRLECFSPPPPVPRHRLSDPGAELR